MRKIDLVVHPKTWEEFTGVMTDPIERIVGIVFDAQGEMTMNDLCQPGIREFVAEKTRDEICMVLESLILSITSPGTPPLSRGGPPSLTPIVS